MTWRDHPACLRRIACRRCAEDPAFVAGVLHRFGEFTCPENKEIASSDKYPAKYPETLKTLGWNAYVDKVRCCGGIEHNKDLDRVIFRLSKLACTCARTTLKQRFMQLNPIKGTEE